MGEGAEVKVKLKVDSNSAKVADDMKKDMDKVHHEAESLSKRATEFGNESLEKAVMLGEMSAEFYEKLAEYAKEAAEAPIEAYREQDAQITKLAGTFTTLDQAGNSMERLHELSVDLTESMAEMTLKTGVAKDALVGAFDNIIERGGKSVDEAEELTEQMAYAARVVPGGVGAMSEAYSQLEAGMVRARNPLVALIASTGTLKGSARSVALQMQHMSIDKQMELADKAIGKMAEKTKAMPLTFDQTLAVLGEVKESVEEIAGGGMMKGLGRAATHFKEMFVDANGQTTPMMDKITAGAEWFGDEFSHVFDMGSAFVDYFLDGFSAFEGPFSMVWDEVFGQSDATWDQALEVAKAIAEVIGVVVKVLAIGVGTAVLIIEKTIKYLMEVIGAIAKVMGEATGWKGAEEFGKTTLQIATKSEQEDKLAKLRHHGGGDINAIEADYKKTAEATGETGYLKELQKAEDQRQEVEDAIGVARNNATVQNAQTYYENFATASKLQDKAAMENIAQFMGNNKEMAEVIGHLGPEVLGNAKDDFIKTLQAIGAKDAAEAVRKGSRADLKIAKTNITQNFNGPMTIKQDFKDADPDRIILQFKQKLAHVGSNRLQAKTTGLFGA